MAKLSSLIVDLQADTASLKSGLDDAKKMIGDLTRKVDSATKTISAMFVLDKLKGAITGLAGFVHAGAEAEDQAGKMAQAAGTTVEAFTRLDYAASLSGISTEELGVSMSKLNKQLGAAAQGGKQQQAVFKALGISIKDSSGHIRSADAVMGDIAERFAGMEDGAAKSALAIEIFGKSGARMIPMLNLGKAGLKEMADEADRFGFTVSGASAKQAEVFNDSIKKMESISKGLARAVSAELTPALSALATEMLNSVKNTDNLKLAAQGIAIVFKGIAGAGILLVGVFQHVGITIAGLLAAMDDFTSGNLDLAHKDLKEMANAIGENFDTVQARLKALTVTTEDTTEKQKKAHKGSADSILADQERIKKALEDREEATKKITKVIEDLQIKADYFGQGEDQIMTFRVATGDLSVELSKMGDEAGKATTRILSLVDALHQKETAQKAKDAVKDIRTHEGGQFRETLDNQAMDKGFASNAPQPIAPKGLRAGTDLKVAGKVVDAAIAADAKLSGQIHDALGALGDGILSGVKRALTGLLGAMGGIGSIIGNFIQTFQQEGFWQALIGAIGEIIAAAPAFAQVVDIAAGILKYIVGALDGLIGAIGTLLGAIGGVIEIVINALAPLFDGLAQFLTDLAPILFIVGSTLKVSITPLAKALGSALKALSPVLRVLFDIIKGVVLFSFYILRALGNAWNGIVGAISGFLRMIGNISIFGAKPFAALLGWADSVDKAKITMVGLENSIKELEDASYDSAQASQDARTEEYKAAGAADKASKAMIDVSKAAAGLTNVPALLKVNRLRGLASDTAGMPQFFLYIDGQQVFTTVSKYSKKSRFNQDGSRMGGI